METVIILDNDSPAIFNQSETHYNLFIDYVMIHKKPIDIDLTNMPDENEWYGDLEKSTDETGDLGKDIENLDSKEVYSITSKPNNLTNQTIQFKQSHQTNQCK